MFKLINKKGKYVKQEGITLTALTVTIIILLILAAVSIATISRTKWNTNKSNR